MNRLQHHNVPSYTSFQEAGSHTLKMECSHSWPHVPTPSPTNHAKTLYTETAACTWLSSILKLKAELFNKVGPASVHVAITWAWTIWWITIIMYLIHVYCSHLSVCPCIICSITLPCVHCSGILTAVCMIIKYLCIARLNEIFVSEIVITSPCNSSNFERAFITWLLHNFR